MSERSFILTVLSMVLDSLSGRSPLYRIKEFFHEQDTELLLGVEVPAQVFCNHNLVRIMDKIFETGTQNIFSAIANTGWKDKPTKRPTAFMMTTKFVHILVLKSGGERQLAKPSRTSTFRIS